MRTKFQLTLICLVGLSALISCGGGSSGEIGAQPAPRAGASIEQFGISWTFDKAYEFGQFANGDYWVVGPVTITAIDPPSITTHDYGDGPRVVNGSMINPTPMNRSRQGYDSEMYAWAGPGNRSNPERLNYDEDLNVARFQGSPINSSHPLVLPAGASLISTISMEAPDRAILRTAAVLTVVASSPPAGSFRPPYAGNDKTINFNRADLDWSALQNLPTDLNSDLMTHTPTFAELEAKFERPWLDHVNSFLARYCHPQENMTDYSRDFAKDIGDAALLLNTNAANAEKETLLIRFVQLGIDNYRNMVLGAGLEEGNWPPLEGQNMGRKLPIVFAGRLLGNDDMLHVGVWDPALPVGTFNPVFQEDLNVFEVAMEDTLVIKEGYTGEAQCLPIGQYVADDIGLPEWGTRHFGPLARPLRDNSKLCAGYRNICAVGMLGHALTIHIMGLKNAWNNDVFLDYHDRWYGLTGGERTNSQIPTRFTLEMWKAYRQDYPPVWH